MASKNNQQPKAPTLVLSSLIPTSPNSRKQELLQLMIADYRDVMQKAINLLWNGAIEGFNPAKQQWNLPKYFPFDITSSKIGARPTRCATSQAIGMVKSLTSEIRLWQWIIKTEREQPVPDQKKIGDFQSKYDAKLAQLKKPSSKHINPELNANACVFTEQTKPNNKFDMWFDFTYWNRDPKEQTKQRYKALGQNPPRRYPSHICIPGNHTYHSLSLKTTGRRINSVMLSEEGIYLRYEFSVNHKQSGSIEGADPGINKVIVLSDGQMTGKCIHGHNLSSINKKLIRKKRGSRGFYRAKQHQINYINWSIKQLNLSQIKQINLEHLQNMRKGKSTSTFLQKFAYPKINSALKKAAFFAGVHVKEQAPAYRSQRCSKCGFVHQKNRVGETFKCRSCGFVIDADLNAAINHKEPLPCLSHSDVAGLNRTTGLYWLRCPTRAICGGANIVPLANKPGLYVAI